MKDVTEEPQTQETPSEAPQQWGIVELMGHVSHAGPITEEVKFGATMGRVDALQRDGAFVTHFFGAASIYRVTYSTEEAIREKMRPYEPPSLAGYRGRGDAFDDAEIEYVDDELDDGNCPICGYLICICMPN